MTIRLFGSIKTTRRQALYGGLAWACTLPAPALAEILTKGSFGSREAYLKRVQTLAAKLDTMPRGEEKRAEMRALAATLSSAVKDMLFNEAQSRKGKVAPPGAAPAPVGATDRANTASGPSVPLSDVPDDWLLQQGGRIQQDLSDLQALLEDKAEPLSSTTIVGLIAGIGGSVAAINRPGT